MSTDTTDKKISKTRALELRKIVDAQHDKAQRTGPQTAHWQHITEPHKLVEKLFLLDKESEPVAAAKGVIDWLRRAVNASQDEARNRLDNIGVEARAVSVMVSAPEVRWYRRGYDEAKAVANEAQREQIRRNDRYWNALHEARLDVLQRLFVGITEEEAQKIAGGEWMPKLPTLPEGAEERIREVYAKYNSERYADWPLADTAKEDQ